MSTPAASLACLLALLTLAACGDSAPPPPASAPSASSSELTPGARSAVPGFYEPAADSLHVGPSYASDPLRSVVPHLTRKAVVIVAPRAGTLQVRLLAAPVPSHVQLTESTPGVRVLWKKSTVGRSLSGGRRTYRVAWAFHTTPANTLVEETLDGLGSEEVREALLSAAPDWRSRSLSEWWWSVESATGHVRGWSQTAWWSPRPEKPYGFSGGEGVPFDDMVRFQGRPADAALSLGRWTWFWPGSSRDMGTRAFIDARRRLGFEELLPDSRVRIGGEVYPPDRSPYLTWHLVAHWIPRTGSAESGAR